MHFYSSAASRLKDGLYLMPFSAFTTQDGRKVWEYDTARDYQTVNGVKGNAGSMSNAGATIAGGMVFTNSGYSHHGGLVPGHERRCSAG